MARSTFEGPILSGDNRFGPLRNVGYSQLVQNVDLDISNSVVGTSTYSGSSGQFVSSNNIPNLNGTVYVPSATATPVAQTIPADTTTNIYRGAVFYLPTGCDLDEDERFTDLQLVPAMFGASDQEPDEKMLTGKCRYALRLLKEEP